MMVAYKLSSFAVLSYNPAACSDGLLSKTKKWKSMNALDNEYPKGACLSSDWSDLRWSKSFKSNMVYIWDLKLRNPGNL